MADFLVGYDDEGEPEHPEVLNEIAGEFENTRQLVPVGVVAAKHVTKGGDVLRELRSRDLEFVKDGGGHQMGRGPGLGEQVTQPRVHPVPVQDGDGRHVRIVDLVECAQARRQTGVAPHPTSIHCPSPNQQSIRVQTHPHLQLLMRRRVF